MPPTAYLTSNNVGYVRLHGRNPRNAMGGALKSPNLRVGQSRREMRQHDYLYTESELEEWSKRLERINRYAEADVRDL